jgi:hypothetical protein
MSGKERRKQERIRVHFPCELTLGRKSAAGTVRDLSAGGLSVETDASPDQGECVRVSMQPKGRASIDLEALVWSVRTLRNRSTKNTSTRLGLVLSDAPPEFFELVKPKKTTQPVASSPRPTATPAPPPETGTETEPETCEEVRRFRVQVKQSASSRTRRILVFAESEEDAKEKALAEAGAEWGVLEVFAA